MSYNRHREQFTNKIIIDKPGHYDFGFIDASGYDNGILIMASDVYVYTPDIFGAKRINLIISSDADPIENINVFEAKSNWAGSHGIHCVGQVSYVTLYKCEAYHSGITYPSHGISAAAGGQNTFNWELVGNTEFRALINLVCKNITRVIIRSERDLTSAEWNQQGDYIHIDINDNPALLDLRFITEECHHITRTKPIAAHTKGAPGEGHGIVFDDYVCDSEDIDALSYDNAGAAFTNNGGRNNKYTGKCVEYGNKYGFLNYPNSQNVYYDDRIKSEHVIPA